MIDIKRTPPVIFSVIFTLIFLPSGQAQDSTEVPDESTTATDQSVQIEDAVDASGEDAVVTDSAEKSMELLSRADAMMADAENVTREEWDALSHELELSISDIAQRQQRLNGDLRQQRQDGKKNEAVQVLLREKEELEGKIHSTIENLPEVVGVQDSLGQAHENLLDTMSMRTKIQQFIRADIKEDIAVNAKTEQR